MGGCALLWRELMAFGRKVARPADAHSSARPPNLVRGKKMAKHYVYSTLTNDTKYVRYAPARANGAPNVELDSVLIAGGANRADKHLITPRGVMTQVTDEQLEMLQNNEAFKRHVEQGYMLVRTDRVDPEVAVAADMEQRDGAAPLTPNTMKGLGAKPMDAKSKKTA